MSRVAGHCCIEPRMYRMFQVEQDESSALPGGLPPPALREEDVSEHTCHSELKHPH